MTRIAIVEKKRCNPHICGNYLCMRLCPVNRTGEECIKKSSDNKILIEEELCNGCGICQQKCPFEAISIINLPEKLKQDPVHRYGKNQFELFELPIPKKNMVIGIIGRNGIGKTTALSILAGEIIPNFGKYNKKPDKEEIIKRYSNNYLGEYFKKLYSQQIKISYKPQRVELIPKSYKGKVGELLNKVDERKIVNKLIKELEIENLLERDLDNLSGGELQKVAIIATAAKDADVYYFDEPSSFLDITARIKIARLFVELKENKSVIVVEHDLATLDYISDEIQIIYGEQGSYGVISQSKAVRRGINEYLDGFLPEDNVRFRNYKIIFQKPVFNIGAKPEVGYKYPDIEKKFTGFKMKISGGAMYKGKVNAIMGSNGLGKTTFLKIISGLEKADKGIIEKKTISYKPQYLKQIKGNVKEYIKEIAKENFESGWYKQNILIKLNIKHLLDHDLSELSGGELQKVYIAATLSTAAEIIALDEPSAFIDVEDRLNVAEVIKEFTLKKEVCTIVVDHDVQFIDYIADSLLVFEGMPGKEGHVYGPCEKPEGMNRILKMLDITYRKDKLTNRPRINKPDSQLDQEQKKKNRYYYNE